MEDTPEEPLPEIVADDTDPDPEEVARSIVLRQLTAAPKSRRQLAQKLSQKNVADDVAEAVLDRFEEVQLVNDAEFARMWVHSRQRSRGLARASLRRELKDKGIRGDAAEEALDEITDDQERVAAVELVEKKIRRQTVASGTSPEDRKQRDKVIRRLVSMLSRKGYPPGMAFDVVKEIIDAADLESEPLE